MLAGILLHIIKLKTVYSYTGGGGGSGGKRDPSYSLIVRYWIFTDSLTSRLITE